MKAIIYKTKDATKHGDYKKTELDMLKEKADLHNCGWLSTRAEIYINRPDRVNIKEGRGVERCKDNSRVFFVTEAALRKLEQRYTIAPNW